MRYSSQTEDVYPASVDTMGLVQCVSLQSPQSGNVHLRNLRMATTLCKRSGSNVRLHQSLFTAETDIHGISFHDLTFAVASLEAWLLHPVATGGLEAS